MVAVDFLFVKMNYDKPNVMPYALSWSH